MSSFSQSAAKMRAMKKILLLIDLNNSLRSNLAQHLRQQGFEVFEADNQKTVLDYFSNITIDLVILGIEGLKLEGISILRMLRKRHPAIPVVTINSATRFDLSIECMRLGAHDDLLIPFDLDALRKSVDRALRKQPQRE